MQPNTSSDFVADKVMAILVLIGAVCGGCAGIGMLGFGGLAGAVGVAGASGGAEGSGQVATAGGLVMLLGILYLGLAVVAFIGAIGMLKSQRKGFNITMIVMGALAIVGVITMVAAGGGPQSIIGIAIDLLIAGYCWGRLNGKIGPAIPA